MNTETVKSEVLICGAGPTGLVLALRLARAGVRFRIVDASPAPGTSSRALVVQARTLEFYRQMGLAEALMNEGVKFGGVNFWVRARKVGRAPLLETGRGLSRFPDVSIVTQDRHERFLVEQLGHLGIEVERSTELIALEQSDRGVRATLRRADGREESCEASYVAGCDGARSAVRHLLGVDFPGGTYSRVFYVADVEATGAVMNSELHIGLDDAEFLGIFPLRGGTTARLIGTVDIGHEKDKDTVKWEDVGRSAAKKMGIDVQSVNWFSTYRVHHRVAHRFRDRRVFLLGDAAHVHSPVGGQGMNTGIGDAVNLAWKLADVLKGRADASLLDSYEPERRGFALKLVSTTDRAFVFITSSGRFARFVRTRIAPIVIPKALSIRRMLRFVFKTVSQTGISYRRSPLCAGGSGSVLGGDRLPWVEHAGPGGAPDNFANLDGRSWQAHVYGTPNTDIAEACRTLGIPLRMFPWQPAMKTAGLAQNALYLLRPDGYIALLDPAANPTTLERHWRAMGYGRSVGFKAAA